MNEFEIDKRQVRQAFSRAAQDYDAAAVLQREVCTRMLERLHQHPVSTAAIPCRMLAAGTGWVTRQLASSESLSTPPLISPSATRPLGSAVRTASRTESEIWSATLSGWPSVTDSEVNENERVAIGTA